MSLFTQHIDTALASAVGPFGADAALVAHWRGRVPERYAVLGDVHGLALSAIIDLPNRDDDLAEIESVARRIAENYSTLVILGMGGSSLGAQTLAAIADKPKLTLHVLDNIDPVTFDAVMEALDWKRTAFLIVSKSGTTVEVHAMLAALLHAAKARGADIAKHCFCLTIPNDNPLHRLATERGMTRIAHDAHLCGRFSILSNVGLIPAAALGLDVRALRTGAAEVLSENARMQGPVADAAAINMTLMDHGLAIHVLMHYADRLGPFVAWFRQCWSESLGKEGKGTLPVRSRGATEQHSQLQLYLDGPTDKYFTALVLDTAGQGPSITLLDTPDARFDYLKNHRLGDLLLAEQRGTNATLVAEGFPLRTLTFDRLDERVLGGLLMYFTLETLATAALMEVNPFDQPAVEASKRRTLELLVEK